MEKSGIVALKSKFFVYRSLAYFGFLLVPIWIQKLMDLNTGLQIFFLMLYQLFMVGQWFQLGKEIDHRLKIYYRINSSFDRVFYRILIGMVSVLLIYNIFSLLPHSIVHHFFWGFWVVLGIFYSWPTRQLLLVFSSLLEQKLE